MCSSPLLLISIGMQRGSQISRRQAPGAAKPGLNSLSYCLIGWSQDKPMLETCLSNHQFSAISARPCLCRRVANYRLDTISVVEHSWSQMETLLVTWDCVGLVCDCPGCHICLSNSRLRQVRVDFETSRRSDSGTDWQHPASHGIRPLCHAGHYLVLRSRRSAKLHVTQTQLCTHDTA